MDKQKTDGERRGHDALPQTDTVGTAERERRESAEQERGREGERVGPGGEGAGRPSEGSREAHRRAMRRSRRTGRVKGEMGGGGGFTKGGP